MTSTPSLQEEFNLISPGHLACAGCTATLAMRYTLEALGPRTVLVMPACCWSIICGPFPHSAVRVPVFHCAFETGAVTASGVRAAMDMQGNEDVNVVTWAGDGGTFDIGFQALSGAAERNDDIIYICYDNEAYMNTGIQRSSATPPGTWTTTTPAGKLRPKKNIVEIMAAHRIPYAATACVSYPDDFIAKMRKAKDIKGTRFFHVLAPCPTGWRIDSAKAVKIGRMAVKSRAFPLYEIDDGDRFTLTHEEEQIPIADYLNAQGRFEKLNAEAAADMQQEVDKNFRRLQKLSAARDETV